MTEQLSDHKPGWFKRSLDRTARSLRAREKFDSLSLAEQERRMRGVRLPRRRVSINYVRETVLGVTPPAQLRD